MYLLLAMIGLGCETEGPGDYKDHFIKYYGEDGDQDATDLIVNPDGTIVIIGTSTIANSKKVYVVKVDEQGKQLWSLKFGGGTNETGQDIERIISGPDVGNYLAVSNAVKSDEDSLAIRLTVISENGDSLKSFLIDRYESQEAKSLTVFPSGEYYITGQIKNTDTLNVEFPGFDLEDYFDMIISNSLTLVSSERIGGSAIASGIKIIDRPNSINYALYTDEFTDGDGVFEANFVFRKYDKINNDEKTFYAGTPRLNEYLADVDQSFSGIFMAVGTQLDPSDVNVTRIYASTINSNFDLPILSQDNIEGSPSRAEGVSVAHDVMDGNSFWVLGNEFSPGGSNRNIWIGKVNANSFQTIFSKKFGGANNDDTGSKVLQLQNGDVLILGTMELVNQRKMALIKIKANGSF
jgi:hypothetical protein